MSMIRRTFSSSRARLTRTVIGAAMSLAAFTAFAASGWSPVPGDYQTILKSKSSTLVVWRLAENPDVFVLDFPTLAQQGHAFNRITQLTEQFSEAYKRVLTGDEFRKYLESIHRSDSTFAYGHDVLVSELALFYNLADRDKIELTPEEATLREFLVEQGFFRSWRGINQALKPDIVLVTVPQTRERGDGEPKINDSARRAVLLHELSHGEFYTNQYYAAYCRKFWSETLTDNQRAVFTRFLSKYNYSVNQDELLINETQAYLMFTPDPNSFSAAKLGIEETELAEMRNAFRRGRPPTKLPLTN
jgi:hypothetical protein